MKRELATVVGALLIFSGVSHASVGLRFGLGNAVAKRSADLIDTAATSNGGPVTGTAVAATLPSCTADSIYDSPPTDLSMIGGIDPLGHVAPPGHTFPSDHIYYYSSTSTVFTPPVFAPGAIHVISVASSEYLSATPPFVDYAVYFYACKEVKSYYGHVRTLTNAFAAKVGPVTQNCSTSITGTTTIRRCEKNLDITIVSGEQLGSLAPSSTLDFGTYDYRSAPLDFINPSRHGPDEAYTVCPIDYFSSGPQSSMQALLGRFDGGYRRTTAPACGEINYDEADTARGYWYFPNAPDTPEDPHLSLITDNVYAPKQTISVGSSLPNQSALFYTFTPVASGFVDRDFATVSADGQTYCYDTFSDPLGQPVIGGPTFIISMPTATTLRIEKQNPTSCGSGPWVFTANAVTFQR